MNKLENSLSKKPCACGIATLWECLNQNCDLIRYAHYAPKPLTPDQIAALPITATDGLESIVRKIEAAQKSQKIQGKNK